MEHGKLKHLEQNIKLLKTAQYWQESEIRQYQTKKFLDLVKFSYHHVPFYRELYDAWDLDIYAFNCLEDLERLPMVTKQMIKDMDISYIDSVFDPTTISYMTTGGSTGNPFKIYMNEETRSLLHANTYFYMNMAGFTFENSRNIRLHGDIFTQDEIDNGRYYRIQNGRTLVLSSNHINEDTARIFVDQMNGFDPDYIHAFPSSLAILTICIKRLGLKPVISPKAIFCDCECLYGYQKDLFKEVFNCKVYNIYGHTEGSVFGINCPESDLIHINPVIGLFELTDSSGNPVSQEGAQGEIVVTGFANRVVPFIRYKTEDIGTFTTQTCSCRRNWTTIKAVEGRKQDYIVDKNGSVISLTPTLFDYNIDWTGVDRFQVHQTEIGKLDIHLQINPKFNRRAKDIQAVILSKLKISFGNTFQITSTLVEEIGFTPKGKYRYLEQSLDLGALWQI